MNEMAKYFGIFLIPVIINITLYFILGSFGMANYLDGLILMIGIILTLQLSFIICLLVYLVELLKGTAHHVRSEKAS